MVYKHVVCRIHGHLYSIDSKIRRDQLHSTNHDRIVDHQSREFLRIDSLWNESRRRRESAREDDWEEKDEEVVRYFPRWNIDSMVDRVYEELEESIVDPNSIAVREEREFLRYDEGEILCEYEVNEENSIHSTM